LEHFGGFFMSEEISIPLKKTSKHRFEDLKMQLDEILGLSKFRGTSKNHQNV